jgi:polyisoprenoid-binding protein YceI
MPWEFGFNHSRVEWACRYLGVMTVKGIFKKFDIALNVEDPDPSRWSVEATIDTASLESGHEGRDDVLRGPDYLDVERFPTITFKSTRVERSNDHYRVVGDLTIHGVTREVALDMQYNGEATNRRGELSRVFTAEIVAKRLDFGVGPPPEQGSSIGHDIRIGLEIEVVQREATPAS